MYVYQHVQAMKYVCACLCVCVFVSDEVFQITAAASSAGKPYHMHTYIDTHIYVHTHAMSD